MGELLCMRGEDRSEAAGCTSEREERRRRDKRQPEMQEGVVQVMPCAVFLHGLRRGWLCVARAGCEAHR